MMRIPFTLSLLLLGLVASLPATPTLATQSDFAENPIVYFLITDRFFNGNPANDRSYGREPDGEQEIGTFHGGDLAGLTQKIEEGYFDQLGVNALWITAPYEQIYGWVVGGSKEFKHYAYHGYYALDYTLVDQNMGTEDELAAMIDAAHRRGIRVLFDIVMNHPGYADIQSLAQLQIDVLWPTWPKATLRDYHTHIDYNNFNFKEWWSPAWVRSGLGGYNVGNTWKETTKQLAYLPDFKTEKEKPVDLPPFLQKKKDTKAVAREGYTVRQYLIEWLTAWVRDYGVDGFRCDTVKHVEPEAWAELKVAATASLREWKAAHPEKKIDDADFWMVGEVFPHGVERTHYYDHGFDAIINFDFQEASHQLENLDNIYRAYAKKLHGDEPFDVLTYLSSHDTQLYDREQLIRGGTALFLVPGGVQIFYGDETARPLGPQPGGDPQQATRSSMNWDHINETVLAHWQKLGQFRLRHPAIARGNHQRLHKKPYVFARSYQEDQVVVVLGANPDDRIPVGEIFSDGAKIRDAYSGVDYTVKNAHIQIREPSGAVILLEK